MRQNSTGVCVCVSVCVCLCACARGETLSPSELGHIWLERTHSMQSRATKQELQPIWPMTDEIFPFGLFGLLVSVLKPLSHMCIAFGLTSIMNTQITFIRLWTETHVYAHTHGWPLGHGGSMAVWSPVFFVMSAVAHEGTLKHTPDSMTEGPNYHSHGRGGECVWRAESAEKRNMEKGIDGVSYRVLMHVCDGKWQAHQSPMAF